MKNAPQNPQQNPSKKLTVRPYRQYRFLLYVSSLEQRALDDFARELGVDTCNCLRLSVAAAMRDKKPVLAIMRETKRNSIAYRRRKMHV